MRNYESTDAKFPQIEVKPIQEEDRFLGVSIKGPSLLNKKCVTL